MTYEEDRCEAFILGLHKLIGLKLSDLRSYAKEGSIMHVLDHPHVMHITQQQYEKIYNLKDFINSYHYLRNAELEEKTQLSDTEAAKSYYIGCLAQYREKEMLFASYLNKGNRPIASYKIAEGAVDSCTIDIKGIFKRAIQTDASGIIIAHNHPSTEIQPSQADIHFTEKLFRQTKMMDIALLDHIIVGGECAYSFAENGYMVRWMEKMQEKGTGWSGNELIAENDEVAEGEDVAYSGEEWER